MDLVLEDYSQTKCASQEPGVYILPMISLHIIIPKFQPQQAHQILRNFLVKKNRMRLQKKVCPHCAQCHSSSSQLRCCLVCLSSHTIDNDTAADRSLNGEQKGHKEGPDNEPRRAAVGAMFFFGSVLFHTVSFC